MKRIVAVFAVIFGILTSLGCERFEKEYDGRYYNGENTVDTGKEKSTVVSIGTVKGAEAAGLVKLTQGSFSEYGKQKNYYNIKFFDTDMELLDAFEKREVDIASLSLTRASRLYNQNRNKAVCLAANALCTMALLENGNAVRTPGDVKGKTIYLAGRGNMADAVLEILSEEINIDDDKVNIVYKDNEMECVKALLKKKGSLALISQPYIKSAMDNKNVRTCFDLAELQNKMGREAFVTSVLVANRNFIDNNNDAVRLFLDDFRYSCTFSKEKPKETVKLALENNAVFDGFDEATLKKCGNCCAVGEQLRSKAQSCLDIIYTYEDDLVGGRLPDEDFYFMGVY